MHEATRQLTERLCNDVANLMNLLFGEFSGALGGVDLCDAKHEQTESATETLNDAEAERCLLFAVYVGVLHTEHVLERVCVLDNES